MRGFRSAMLALALTSGWAGTALAQFPQSAVESCLRIAFDPSIAPQIVGTWYVETRSPDGAFVNQQYQQYDQNGLWQYRDQTCSVGMAIPCSQNQGHGVYSVNPQGGGNFYIARLFNDLERTNWCQGAQVRVIDGGTLQLPDGTLMTRVQ